MYRIVWLGLICLLSIGVLFVLRTSIGAKTTPAGTASLRDAAPPSEIEVNTLAKADKLLSASVNDATEKPLVSTAKIASTKPSTEAPKAVSEVTSWHWHQGSKITKRVAGQRGPAAPAQRK